MLMLAQRQTGVMHIGGRTIVFCTLVLVGDCGLLVQKRTQVLICLHRTLLFRTYGRVIYVLISGFIVAKSIEVLQRIIAVEDQLVSC